ncbi:hypothetical protein METBIDRAFT_121406 [Metschnikowia bicuspidata var. bicuspidata NRRL YB-4993]|uniref:Uncharacterized protein n=1 Tax=Metschnikowia bicuspidata var. bicuspidata NRRL YB-4993 TaxID=869754 RepID=A0A1A0HJS6_9ASCO|nr:hypothetical protein METBIDRAFT_121406 [Metschnikowia bicuspidata var. bicuspidata NRRL YB-4993]OBA24251.1 hypothetical protein METBIDRAFT_121406 [Metschnikowia bicuspidata var. bicuspidata NRRL YB-4993]
MRPPKQKPNECPRKPRALRVLRALPWPGQTSAAFVVPFAGPAWSVLPRLAARYTSFSMVVFSSVAPFPSPPRAAPYSDPQVPYTTGGQSHHQPGKERTLKKNPNKTGVKPEENTAPAQQAHFNTLPVP